MRANQLYPLNISPVKNTRSTLIVIAKMFRAALASVRARAFSTSSVRNAGNFEPPYLELLKPPLPVNPERINIQLKGYDFVVLEQQTKKVQKLVDLLDLKVREVWATPLEASDIETFQPFTTATDKTFRLNIYERNIQLDEPCCARLGILIDLIHKNLAAGVTVSLHNHQFEHEEIRHIPDLELEALEKELAAMHEERK